MKKLLWLLMLIPCILAVGCGDKAPDTSADTPASTTTNAPNQGGIPDTSDQPGTTDQPGEPENQPTSIVLDKLRVQLLSDRMVRIEVEGPKGFEDRASFTVQKRTGWEEVSYTSASENGYTVITTSAYKVYVPDGAATPVGCYITDAEGTELWRYETNTTASIYLPSPSDELSSWFFTDSPRVIPSENGYSVVEDYERHNGWDLSNNSTDLFVFLPQGEYENFTSDFIKLTGSSEMVTLKMLGYWDSRWYKYTAETALQQIRDYQSKGYSIDMLVIDTDWHISTDIGGVGYEVNTALFPDMEKFLEEAHKLGVDIVFNDHPEPVDGTSNLLDEKEIAYRSDNLKLILSLGMDYWWYDRNWEVSLNPIQSDLSIYATGQYAFQFITEEYYNSITDMDEYARRALIMSNVDGIRNGVLEYAPELGSHRYSIQWTGDIQNDMAALEQEIFNAVFGSTEMGLPYISSDIGGFWNECTDEDYVRWMQFGALSPIMRVHAAAPFSRMPWLYGETAEKVTHQYVDMRYRLLPLYYTLAHENYETGLPLLRRLDIDYPQYAESAANDQYLLGTNLLVAPLTETYSYADDYVLTSDNRSGLKAEYYNNSSFSGSPVLTKYETELSHDWEDGGPAGLNQSDNFSIRWTGTITIGSDESALRFFADDGIRVWLDDKLVIDGWSVYDQYLYTDSLEAGSTHRIKIEYFEAGGGAHIYMAVLTDKPVSRRVFLPDGEWMDIWSGKTYAGPAVITVEHHLETSPIFVRMGTVLTLADNMTNVDEKDWSHLTLDVYPSVSMDTETTLYEDDTETVAYKDGNYRTTAIKLSGDGASNQVTLSIDAAKGIFEGERAFTRREWTIRIHGRSDWGALTAVTLNGKALEFSVIAQDPDADPLAIVGGARDNVIYEVTFTAEVADASELVCTFATTVADDVNKSYDAAATEFTARVETVVKEADTEVNLSAYGNKDWAIFGVYDAASVIRKATDTHLIGKVNGVGSFTTLVDNYKLSWQDGDLRKIGSSTGGIFTNANMIFTLASGPDQTHYELHLGGYKSVAKLTIRDRAGNVKTFTFGDLKTNYYRKVIIDCTAQEASELYITYSILCGDNITLSAITASDGTVEDLEPVDPDVDTGADMISVETPYTGKFDLTAEGTLYWEYYGTVDDSTGTQLQQKAGAADRIDTVFDNDLTQVDNPAEVTWSDGADRKSATTRYGKHSFTGETVSLDVSGCTAVKFMVGAWQSKNRITVYDENGIPLASEIVIDADSKAQIAIVTLDLSGYDGDRLTVRLEAVDGANGNVSLTAVAMK